MNRNPADWDYTPASVDFCLAQALQMLTRLYGVDQVESIGRGACDDCGSEADLYPVGRFAVCRRHWQLRRKVAA
jgi:hypothetical protein